MILIQPLVGSQRGESDGNNLDRDKGGFDQLMKELDEVMQLERNNESNDDRLNKETIITVNNRPPLK